MTDKDVADAAERRITGKDRADADRDLRLRVLQLAIGVSQPGTPFADMVGAAEAFHAFLTGATRH